MRRFAVLVLLAVAVALALPPTAAHAVRHVSPCAVATGHPGQCKKVEVLGHRGVENLNEDTLAALRRDAKLGVRFEADTWRLASRDGTPDAGPSVVIHDPTLRRTVDPSCLGDLSPDTKIGEVTPQQWHQLCSRGGEPLPTLKQWIRLAGRLGVPGIMEIKYVPTHPDVVAGWVNASGTQISFYATPHLFNGTCYQTAAVSMEAVGMEMGLKVDPVCPVSLQEAADLGYRYVITGADAEDHAYVKQAHDLGLRVGNYDSDSIAVWTRLVDARADMIIAPHPKRLRDWLR